MRTNGANGFALVQRLTCAWEWAGAPGTRTRHCDPPGVRAVLYVPYAAGGAAGLLARYAALRYAALRGEPAGGYTFDAGQLNGLGYDLLRAGRRVTPPRRREVRR